MSNLTGNGTDHIYYNLTVTNNNTSPESIPPPVSFTETRNQPILNCPDDYYMSVVRFSLETPTLPVLSCLPKQVQEVGDTVDNLQYRVYFAQYDGSGNVTATAYTDLLMQPSSSFVPVPKYPVDLTDTANSYWNCYSYQVFIEMVNTALRTTFFKLYPDTTITSFPPYLYWDIGSNTAVLNVATGLKTLAGGNLQIYFNNSLYTLFSSFPAYRTSLLSGGISRSLYQITINTGPDANISTSSMMVGNPPVSVSLSAYNILQEYPTIPLWTPIDSIVFTTSMIPVVPELTAAPVVYNNNNVFTSIGTNSNITNTLTDFIVPLTTGTEYKPSINYTPQGEYRLSSLFGTNPVNSIQVNVYYKNRFGVLVPITLGYSCAASIKLMFRRKDYSNIILG